MRAADLKAAYQIQLACYSPQLSETLSSFEAKFAVFSDYCFSATSDSDQQLIAYLIAMPCQLGDIPALNANHYSRCRQPDCLYIHDVVVAPSARKGGTAATLLATAANAAKQSGLKQLSLAAVDGADSYWQRLGFAPSLAANTEKLASYGKHAVFMQKNID
jgi:GNAT superfamily N-acetyltransferase